MDPLVGFQRRDTRLVRAGLRRGDPCAGARLARDRARREHADPGADRLGQDARGLPLRDRPPQRRAGRRAAAALRLAAEGAELRHRAQPARAACRPPLRPARGRPHRRHAAEGARRDGAQPARHPDHHARVALPAADLDSAGDAALGRDGDRGRGARGRGHEARRAPGALAGAARPARRQAGPAHRPLGHAAPARGDRPLRLRRPRDRARRRGSRQGARPEGGRAARRHARARGAAVDLALDLPGDPRARPGAPLDDRLREQPPPRGAAGVAPERARRGGDRAGAPRLAGARAARRGRGAAQARADPVPRRHLVARARDRHGRRGPRDPGRVAEVGRARAAADRPRRPRARRRLEGAHLPEVPRRPARVGGGRPAHARRRDRGDEDPAQPARRAGAADRRDLRRRGDRGGRAALARPRGLPVRRPFARPARERARHARRALPLRRVRRAAGARGLGPHRRRRPRAAGRAAARGHQRGHDSRPRPLRRLPRRRRRPGRRARRGDGLRGSRGPDVPARRVDLAHRGDHARPSAGLAGAGCAGRGAVLEGRGRRPPVRARRGDRRDLARACRADGGEGAGEAPRRALARRARGAEPAHLPRRAAGRDRRGSLRPDDRGRALPRRDRRLAALHPDPVRRPGACAVGAGDRCAPARVARDRDPGDLVGRRDRDPPARLRRRPSDRGRAARPRAGRGAGHAGAGRHGALRRALPRERGAVAADPPAPARRAHAACGSSA